MNKSKVNIEVRSPELHKGQRDILRDIKAAIEAMYFTIVCPRQWGKSFFAIQLMLDNSLNNANSRSMFISPTHSQSNKVFKQLLKGIKDMDIVAEKNATDKSITFINGAELYFKSIQQPDNIRGEDIDYMYCDEAALYKKGVFNEILRPMLIVRGKKCYFFTTPKGKNYIFNIFKLADVNARYRSYRGKYTDNPYANLEEIEDARKILPELIFRQEYLAEFIEDGGEVFTNLRHNATIKKYREYTDEEIKLDAFYAGIDSGRQNDFTVLTILNRAGEVVYFYRANQKNWSTIINEITAILKRFKPKNTMVEVNGIGDVVYSLLIEQYYDIEPFLTTNETKQNIIEELILALQDQKIKIPTEELCPELHNELMDFGFEYSKKTRKITYGARNGHDDTVMSLAIANYNFKFNKNKGSYAVA